eukprot:scaffold2008_cov283-Pinguiococcus_pyrenoidosus.AAC.9
MHVLEAQLLEDLGSLIERSPRYERLRQGQVQAKLGFFVEGRPRQTECPELLEQLHRALLTVVPLRWQLVGKR